MGKIKDKLNKEDNLEIIPYIITKEEEKLFGELIAAIEKDGQKRVFYTGLTRIIIGTVIGILVSIILFRG